VKVRAILLTIAAASGGAACSTGDESQPVCSRHEASILMLEAQSVPSATFLPCIAELPIGWQFGGSQVRDGGTTLWLDHDRAGFHAVEVVLAPRCDVAAAVEVPPAPDEVGMRTYQQPETLDPFVGTRSLLFPGGCIEYHYRFSEGSASALVIEADRALSSVPRTAVVTQVRRDFDLSLCGAGATKCAG
jgi:hypothetical protein